MPPTGDGPRRRTLLAGLLGAAAAAGLPGARAQAPAPIGSARPRVLIVGGGWAGLSALHTLCAAGDPNRSGPTLVPEVTLIDRERDFRSLPLSTPWLVGRTPERLPRVDLAAHAERLGARFLSAEVLGIDRARRVVESSAGALPYDRLILATGAVPDARGWFDGDAQAVAEAQRLWRSRFPSGFVAGELDRTQQALQAFAERVRGSGRSAELLLSVPPAPYRCPPAPYERAILLAGWLRAQRLPVKITLLDAGGGMPRFTRLFQERWRGVIEHRPYSEVRRVDPQAQTVTTDDGELPFDHALLLPPMGAGPLCASAGLLGQDAAGRPSRWAAVDATTLRSPHDAHTWLAGDGLDSVSILFGAYPKTAQIAAELGAAAARQVLADLRGGPALPPADALPSSQCHVWLDADPPEQLRIDTTYRLRGDGVPMQTLRQVDNPQPRDEDLAWARGLLARRLGIG